MMTSFGNLSPVLFVLAVCGAIYLAPLSAHLSAIRKSAPWKARLWITVFLVLAATPIAPFGLPAVIVVGGIWLVRSTIRHEGRVSASVAVAMVACCLSAYLWSGVIVDMAEKRVDAIFHSPIRPAPQMQHNKVPKMPEKSLTDN